MQQQDVQQPVAEENELDDVKAELQDGKIGAKKRAKLEAKAEKQAQRKADEHIRTEKRKKDELAERERKKVAEQEQLEEQRRLDEAVKAREAKEKREHDEYLRMKEAFSVEEEGYDEMAAGGEQANEMNLLQQFVDYIKTNKVVVIEDLAAHFKLKTQAAIDRIKDLQSDDILSGVIDDRGKFIYVSQDEMNAVAKFIRQRGRVSIAELAENSNSLINLTPVKI